MEESQMVNRKSSTMSHNEVKKFLKDASMEERINFILDNPCFLDIMYQENMIDYNFAKRITECTRGFWFSLFYRYLSKDEMIRLSTFACSIDPGLLAEVKYKTKGICEAAVIKNGRILSIVPSDFIDKKMCILAVSSDPTSIKFVPDKFITDTIVSLAVSLDPETIKFIPYKYQSIEDVKKAIKYDAECFNYINPAFKIKHHLKLLVLINPDIVQFLDYNNDNKEYFELAVEVDGTALRFVPEMFRTFDICKSASFAKNGDSAFAYIPKELYYDVLHAKIKRVESISGINNNKND